MPEKKPSELVIPISIEYDGKTYRELRLSEPSMRTIKRALPSLELVGGEATPASGFEFMSKLLSEHTGIPQEALEELKATTVVEGGTFLMGFLESLAKLNTGVLKRT